MTKIVMQDWSRRFFHSHGGTQIFQFALLTPDSLGTGELLTLLPHITVHSVRALSLCISTL